MIARGVVIGLVVLAVAEFGRRRYVRELADNRFESDLDRRINLALVVILATFGAGLLAWSVAGAVA